MLPSFRASWKEGDAVVDRGNAGWTTSKGGRPCLCQNCLQWPPAETNWKRISAESSVMSAHPHFRRPDRQRTERNWTPPRPPPLAPRPLVGFESSILNKLDHKSTEKNCCECILYPSCFSGARGVSLLGVPLNQFTSKSLTHYSCHPAVGYCGYIPSVENQEFKGSPFKAWSRSECSHACFANCQGFSSLLISTLPA